MRPVIPLFKVFMPESVMAPLRDVLFSGWVGEGPRARHLETALALWFGTSHVLTVNSGTSALQLALRLAGVGPGDEVVSTPMTCVATNEPILTQGARVVWADIDPWTGNISPSDVAHRITPRTRAIMAVHWGGYPCDLRELSAIAHRHGLPIIEDACQAFGAEYDGRPIGSHSDFVCFSFQAIKHVTSIDGGALTCRTVEATRRGRRLRWYGLDRATTGSRHWDQDIEEPGYKFHMNDVAATIALEQLTYAPEILSKHRAHARAYDEALRDVEHVRPLRYERGRLSAYWLYTVRVRQRTAFIQHMADAGITASRVHVRNDRYGMFASSTAALPGVSEFDEEQVSVPCGWWLDDGDVARVVDAMVSFRPSSRAGS